MILNVWLFAAWTAHVISADRDLDATVQFSLLGLVLSLAFLRLVGPAALVQAAMIESGAIAMSERVGACISQPARSGRFDCACDPAGRPAPYENF